MAGETTPFTPLAAARRRRQAPTWVDFEGRVCQPPATILSAEDVAVETPPAFSIEQLPFRDPDAFVAGQLHNHLHEWEKIIGHTAAEQNIRAWLSDGVNIEAFFKPFRGNFKGKAYNSPKPGPGHFANATCCRDWGPFISATLEEWIACGAIEVVGKVGVVEPPYIVMPLTVEPTKPRLCHDERFLNLWIKDNPFTLETLKDVPRLIEVGDFLTSCDHKSGYQHVRLHPESYRYFGMEWNGWYMTYRTLPFGFKASTYVYQALSNTATGYIRHLGVASMTYIDDSLNGPWRPQGNARDVLTPARRHRMSEQGVYIVCQTLIRLGYTLSLSKSVLRPTGCLLFLGMVVDALRGAFLLPESKKTSFAALREGILGTAVVNLKTIQRLQGKCISFMPAIPAAKLYTSEMACAISKACKSSKAISISGLLREEIQHWRFIDDWDKVMPWRDEKHLHFRVATDSSRYGWGAFIMGGPRAGQEMSDLWPQGDVRPIHVKEAHALLNALVALKAQICNHRVDIAVDNQAVIGAWEGQKSRDTALTAIMKEISQLLLSQNAQLRLQFIPSAENPADAPSRTLSGQDCMLGPEAWHAVQQTFGPHTIDLMAVDSNCQRDNDGKPLRHFTPHPTPESSGVNIFAQDLSQEKNPYCYPPLCLISSVLALLKGSGVQCCTIVTPSLTPLPIWGLTLARYAKGKLHLGKAGDKAVLLIPSTSGYVPDQRGLRWDLCATKLCFKE